MKKVSVIVPFFKVEPFIGRCAESLLSQTLEDVEFIFVDDESPDGSRSVLEQVISKHPDRDVRIITHQKNKGLPAARNTGLSEAEGEYIYHCDSDDWVETDMLEKMYGAATESGADFVYSDFWMQFESSSRYMGNPDFDSPEQMIKEGFLAGTAKYNVWNKLIKRSVYESSEVLFPSGHGMGEDMTVILLATHAKKVCHVSEALYHYVKLNANAFSNTFSERHLQDIRFNSERTLAELSGWNTSEKEKYLNLFKLNVKLPFLFTDDKKQYEIWKEWFPEANDFILKNPFLPKRTIFVQWLASKGLFPLVSLYTFLVNKVYYKLKYRI